MPDTIIWIELVKDASKAVIQLQMHIQTKISQQDTMSCYMCLIGYRCH